MLRYSLLHPELLAVLAGAGHGSRILIADANYAHRTNTGGHAPVIHLNLRPGLVTVTEVLETLVEAVPVEAAALMRPDDGSPCPAEPGYREILGSSVHFAQLFRAEFYRACRGHELAGTVATGDQRHYANVLLTIGSLPAPEVPTPGGS
jgi:L-fucose mutarotase